MAKKAAKKAKSKPQSKTKKAPPKKAVAKVSQRRKSKPKDQALPGMEDHAIPELEQYAQSYADIRDQRIVLNREEHDLKEGVMKAMKRHGKTIYKHGGITITMIAGEDDVKVKVRPEKDEDEDGEADEAASDELTEEPAEATE